MASPYIPVNMDTMPDLVEAFLSAIEFAQSPLRGCKGVPEAIKVEVKDGILKILAVANGSSFFCYQTFDFKVYSGYLDRVPSAHREWYERALNMKAAQIALAKESPEKDTQASAPS